MKIKNDSIALKLRTGRTPYFNLKRNFFQKKKIKQKLDQFNKYLKTYGLSFSCIEISSDHNNDKYLFNIIQKKVNRSHNEICQEAKDLSLMSHKSYDLFRKTVGQSTKLASLKSCNDYKKKLNRFWIVKNNKLGSFIEEPIQKIKFVCLKYLNDKIKYSSALLDAEDFKILLCGDSINVTKTNLNVMNFTFSLLNNEDLSKNGFFTLGIFNLEKEKYENFDTALKELLAKLQNINELEINGKIHRIKFFFGGDLKWISEVYGINAANSLYPCPWCTWKAIKITDDYEIKKKFSIFDRSHEIAKTKCNSKNKSVDYRQGYKNASLFPFIQFHNVVVDILHLTLRISDKLFELLLFRLEELEENLTNDLTNTLKDFFEKKCKISSPFFISEKKLKLRALNQNERFKFFDNLLELEKEGESGEETSNTKQHKKDKKKVKPLTSLFPLKFHDDITLERLSDLCINFRKIIIMIKDVGSRNNNLDNIKKKLKEWLIIFIKIEPKITPYIHIFCFHVPEFIETHKNLNLFSMQGLENLNGFIKHNYFRQTNRKKDIFTKMLLEKMNRMEFYSLDGKLDSSDEDQNKKK